LTVHPSQHRKALFWRPPLAHRRFDSASLLPRKERGVHGETFDRMSFKFGATWRERYFAWLVWAGNPSPLPLHRTSLIACHSEQSSSSIIVKASKESRSRPVACNEVGAFYTEAGGCGHRSAVSRRSGGCSRTTWGAWAWGSSMGKTTYAFRGQKAGCQAASVSSSLLLLLGPPGGGGVCCAPSAATPEHYHKVQ